MTDVVCTLVNVDDHEASRYARSRILRLAGFDVIDTGSGVKALELVNSQRPHVIVLDVNLPDMSGLEVCRRIKTNPDTAATMVLQISASAVTNLDRVAGLENGADTYLIEPVDPGVLIATVNALLRLFRTERKLQEANRELARSNADLAQFAYAASHDLQEPLRTVISYSQLLARRCGSQLPPEALTWLDFIGESGQRMRDLVHGLLSYSRVGVPPAQYPVNLNDALNEAKLNLKVLIDESGAEIEAEPLPVVRADFVEMLQVMSNLLTNALKYRGSNPPKIRIACERADKHWTISVQDNGIGFDSRYAQYIFEPFRRLDKSKIPGSGVGLAICRRVIEKHGGRIWAVSTPGEGSTFFFALPVEQGVPERAQARLA